MKSLARTLLLGSCLLLPFLTTSAQPPGTQEKQIIAALKQWGGAVRLDDDRSSRPVISVRFEPTFPPKVIDPGLEHLQGLSELEEVDLQGAKVTDKGVVHLQRLTGLVSLSLVGTEVSDAGLKHLQGLKHLGELFLQDTKVTDQGLGHLEDLPRLRVLGIGRTKITDDGLKHLQGLRNLEVLDLSETDITDAGLKHLQGLTRLRKVYLYRNKVTDAGTAELRKALSEVVVIWRPHVLVSAPASSLPEEGKPAVSLVLAKASAERKEQDTFFRCEALLHNGTGKDLTVLSRFSSAFDGLELVVTTPEGKTLFQQPYTYHQSPFAPPGREFVLKQGSTATTLVFPIRDLPGNAKEVKVRLVGTLPGSTYPRILSTDSIEVKVKD